MQLTYRIDKGEPLTHIEGDNNLKVLDYKYRLAAGDPSQNDDSSSGFQVGSRWENIDTGVVFKLEDSSENNAVWSEVKKERLIDKLVDFRDDEFVDSIHILGFNPAGNIGWGRYDEDEHEFFVAHGLDAYGLIGTSQHGGIFNTYNGTLRTFQITERTTDYPLRQDGDVNLQQIYETSITAKAQDSYAARGEDIDLGGDGNVAYETEETVAADGHTLIKMYFNLASNSNLNLGVGTTNQADLEIAVRLLDDQDRVVARCGQHYTQDGTGYSEVISVQNQSEDDLDLFITVQSPTCGTVIDGDINIYYSYASEVPGGNEAELHDISLYDRVAMYSQVWNDDCTISSVTGYFIDTTTIGVINSTLLLADVKTLMANSDYDDRGAIPAASCFTDWKRRKASFGWAYISIKDCVNIQENTIIPCYNSYPMTDENAHYVSQLIDHIDGTEILAPRWVV